VSPRRAMLMAAASLGGAGAVLLSGQAYLHVKGRVARVLIDRACAAYLADGLVHRPWSWADTHPIARLEVPRLGVREVVLSGATGPTLAFGLGHVSGTALPAAPGNCAIAAHRDRWGAFLRDLRLGDDLVLSTPAGAQRYRVAGLQVVPKGAVEVLAPSAGRRLTLITCYPFSGLLRSPWRFVVTCDEETVAAEPAISRTGSPSRGSRRDREPSWSPASPPGTPDRRSRGRALP